MQKGQVLFVKRKLSHRCSVYLQPGTIPQGSVDMNKCTDVFDAEERTGHEYSIGITVPNQPSSYVKGTSKDEIQRWVLITASHNFIEYGCLDYSISSRGSLLLTLIALLDFTNG